MGAPHVSDFGVMHKNAICGAGRGVAGGAGDNTAITGVSIDRLGFGSLTFLVAARAVLAAGATLNIAAEYQESDDGTTFGTAVSLQASTTLLTGGAGGSTELGIKEFDLDLSAKKRYIRFNFTPDLSASVTDTFEVASVAILGGADKLPA